ncbi:hypothetical protein C8N30_0465 [Sulfitobacter guttiformis]|uniref:Uncharacterized protein n=1 Tax=Sulfitobacter guttiformis TaxID=74349 RepID=A0A420DP24_9RHOB|nr:hypothetical protein C8N30_0465 [Sulfitobacter guttiformis]
MHNSPGSAPDYTKAAVVMFGVNITWIFMMIWAIWGLLAVAATGWVIHHCINCIGRRRG